MWAMCYGSSSIAFECKQLEGDLNAQLQSGVKFECIGSEGGGECSSWSLRAIFEILQCPPCRK